MSETQTIDERNVQRFLLGDLSEQDRVELEERIFRDDAFYQQVLALQEELADDYAHGNLSADDRRRFESYFLRSPRRRERVGFATALSRALTVEAASQARSEGAPSIFSRVASVSAAFFGARPLAMAASFAGLALLAFACWLFVQNRQLSTHAEQALKERLAAEERLNAEKAETEQNERKLERQLAELKARGDEMKAAIDQKQRELDELRRSSSSIEGPETAIATFILSPGLTRGNDEPEKVMIAASSKLIRLQLTLEREEAYRSYVAEARTARGNLIFSKSLPGAQQMPFGQAVTITVPANILPIGEYEIALKGADKGKLNAVGYYYFIVIRR